MIHNVRRRSPALPVFLASVAFFAHASAVHAQQSIVVIVTGDDTSVVERGAQVASMLTRQMQAKGISVLPPEEASRRFRRRHSTAPAAVSTAVYEELSECADALLVEVASGRYRSARETGQRCRALVESSLESLNRSTQSARQVLDSCLYVVRAILDADSRDDPSQHALRSARAELLRCRAMVPDIPASEHMHTERVRSLLAEVDASLLESATAMHIDSTQRGCRVYVNGRRLGSTPLSRSGLPPGTYAVQVECDDTPGRVHTVELTDGTATIQINERFDRAVRVEADQLSLLYSSADAHGQFRHMDARTIGDAVGASQTWLLSSTGHDTWRIDRLSREECAVHSSVLVALDDSGRAFLFQAGGVAADRLIAGQSADLSSARESLLAPWESPTCNARPSVPAAGSDETTAASASGSGPDVGPAIATWSALTVGLAGIAVGWSLELTANISRQGLSIFPVLGWSEEELQAWQADKDEDQRLRVGGVTGVAIGATALGLSLPFWLPEAESALPWWSIVSGVAGIGLASWGVYAIATHGQCSDPVDGPNGEMWCREAYIGGSSGILSLLSAAVLLEVPLIYLFRSIAGDDSGPVVFHVRPSLAGAAFGLQGAW